MKKPGNTDPKQDQSSSDYSAVSSSRTPTARDFVMPTDKKSSIVTIASQKTFKNTMNKMLSDNRVRNDQELDDNNQVIQHKKRVKHLRKHTENTDLNLTKAVLMMRRDT